MAYTVQISPAARRQIKKLSHLARKKIIKCLEELEMAPRPPGAVKIEGKKTFTAFEQETTG